MDGLRSTFLCLDRDRSMWARRLVVLLLVAILRVSEAFVFLRPASHAVLPPAVAVATRVAPICATRSSTGTVSSSAAPPLASPSPSAEVAKDLATIQAYLNEKHGELLEKFVLTFTPTGQEIRKKNFWRGDACVIASVAVESLDLERMRLAITIKETGLFGNEQLSDKRQDIVWSKGAWRVGMHRFGMCVILRCSV